ncbi:MAG: 2,3-bisphosphoglycerate-independent phosphoglycerate mutase [Candidatus Woesearchaeota archaeon]|jgi:2,3-bisphosphoglycerate-independent phosphoglycerate mutase
MNDSKHKVLLIIRDGWGYRRTKKDNALASTPTPATDKLMKTYPHTFLNASGEFVGLEHGYQGNSEVGHMTIGSGRIMYQSMERIRNSIKDESFFSIPEFLQAIENAKKNNTSLHLIGLLQIAGVHAHITHLFALLDLCSKQNFKKVHIHIITDGRDSPVTESLKRIAELNKKIKDLGFGEISTISGRFYTMDRDKRWERTKQAYDCIIRGITNIEYDNVIKTIKQSHDENITDEFIVPRKLKNYEGIKTNDSIIFFNFRTDRTRQLTRAIVEKEFEGWMRQPLNVCYVAMTQFYNPMNALVAFKDIELKNLLGQVIANNNLNQFRISETEKYAHVTFFFNGQIEEPNKHEDRLLIPSPHVATYDLKPEMSAHTVSEKLIDAIKTNKYDFIVVNLVNGDMVGHTGILDAIKQAITTVDNCLNEITKAGLENNYTMLVFSDHGNCEDQSEKWRTSHTINKVPCILISNDPELKNATLKEECGLQDIAPTVLELLNITKPEEMTGNSIIKRN